MPTEIKCNAVDCIYNIDNVCRASKIVIEYIRDYDSYTDYYSCYTVEKVLK